MEIEGIEASANLDPEIEEINITLANEGGEQEILLQHEDVQFSGVSSVNGKTGAVVLTTSDLENDSDYQTGEDVAEAVAVHNDDEDAHPYIQEILDEKLDKSDYIIDTELGDSPNPVQNTVITTALAEKVDSNDLAEVAFTGEYDDLEGEPQDFTEEEWALLWAQH